MFEKKISCVLRGEYSHHRKIKYFSGKIGRNLRPSADGWRVFMETLKMFLYDNGL